MGKQGKAITLLAPLELPKWRRMARDLGRPIALERLAIDEQTTVALPLIRPEAPVTLEHEQEVVQRPSRNREHGVPAQERRKPARSGPDDHPAPGMKKQRKGNLARKKSASAPVWESVSSKRFASR